MAANPIYSSSQSTSSKASTPQSGAEIFIQCMQRAGVDTIFGLPGGPILSIYEALQDSNIRHVLVRHEQGATHMAEGYAKTTGKPGVVLVTSGPGATNTITGITDAFYDCIPLVVFTGNVATHMMGNESFQEADIVGMTRPCTKHNIVVRRIEDLASCIAEAFYVATSGRPGPVLVDLPKDVVLGTCVVDWGNVHIELPGYQPTLDSWTTETIAQVLKQLEHAKRPVLLCGGGVIAGKAYEEVLTFAERFQIPVASSLMGLGGFPTSHPLFMGFCGMHGHYWTNIAIANADLLIVAGNRLNERQTGKADRFAKNAKIVHIDMDPCSLERNVKTFLPVQGQLKPVFEALLSQSEGQSTSAQARTEWFSQIEGWKARREKPTYPSDYLTPMQVIERLFHWLPKENSFVTTEVGQHQMWAAQAYNLDTPRSFITSGGFGTMGFGFPAAIGIQFAHRDATVLDIAGDGSFQMTLQELATAKDYGLPVKVAVINNSRLGMIRQWQDKLFGRESEAALTSPDYVKLAEAYGAKGFVVNHPDELDAVIQEAYAITDRPVIIDFRVQERTDVYPWVPAGAGNEEMLTQPETQKEDAQ